MFGKVGLTTIAVLGLMSLAAVPARASDTTPCPAGTVRVVIGQVCVNGLFSTNNCEDITACKRLLVHVPHKPIRALMPPPPSRPFPGPALHAHPRLKLR